MARPERFELPTLCFEGRCSIQLSYGRECIILPEFALYWHIKNTGWKSRNRCGTIPLQFLACHFAVLNGVSVDNPRNLIKAMTP